jgi:hypothetical protein
MKTVIDAQAATEAVPATTKTADAKQPRHPMVHPLAPSQLMPPIRLSHEIFYSKLISDLKVSRPAHVIQAEAHRQTDAIEAPFLRDAANLPEVLYYIALRDRGLSVAEAAVRLETDLAKLERDRQSTMASKDVEAKTLAEELSGIDAERKTISARLEGFKAIRSSPIKRVSEADTDMPGQIAALETELTKLDTQWAKVRDGSATGEKLGVAMAKIEAKQNALKTRIAECGRGRTLLAEEVAKAKTVALNALEAYRKAKSSELYNEADRRMNVAAEAIEAEKHFFDLLDQSALAARVQQIIRTRIAAGESGGNAGISGKLKAILEPKPAAAQVAASAKADEPTHGADSLAETQA